MSVSKKVLVIDDSALMRKIISDYVNKDKRLELIGTATNGKEGLKKAKALKPDVISVDVEMPVMNGLSMIKELMKDMPTPVVVMSSLTKDGAKETLEALELGAVDFELKPDNFLSNEAKVTYQAYTEKLYQASLAKTKLEKNAKSTPRSNLRPRGARLTDRIGNKKSEKIVAIATSTGGPKALQEVLTNLSGNIPAGIVIVQHMPAGFTKYLADRLNQISYIDVKEAEDGEAIKDGIAYIAPGDKYMLVKEKKDGLYIEVNQDPKIGPHRPSADVMYESLAKVKTNKILGVVMTGMGNDGTRGLQILKSKKNIKVIAEDKKTCVVYGMPRSVVENKLADIVVPLDDIYLNIEKQVEVM